MAPDDQRSGSGSNRDPADQGLSRWWIIAGYLYEARKAGVLDEETYQRLFLFLDTGFTPADAKPTPAEPVVAEEPELVAAAEPRERTTSVGARPPVVGPAPIETPPSPPPGKPRVPHEPSPIYGKVRDVWDAVASDVALHGFAYLGVLLTFVGVLGFLLFAFVDLPDNVQPLVELFIALVFFAWAWALRRQNAILVSKGMELIGGMVLPLILFAGLVDNAPFPPDFENGALVLALTVSALLLSMVYLWIGSKWPDSMLRLLVA
ncbi:MAG: hypothetical protein OEO77_14210, partial [Acidimicrobiia bacterium]|nr:hypothetical protein [Acidimicrobiia bacterium]